MPSYDLRDYPPDIELMMACSNWLLADTPANENRVVQARAPAAGVPDLEPVRLALVLCDQAGKDRAARERARRRLSEALTQVARGRREANGIRRRKPAPATTPAPATREAFPEDAPEPWWRR